MKATNNGSSCFDRAQRRVVSGRLGDINIASIFLLPFKMNCHFVGGFQETGGVSKDFVVLPKDDVSQPNGTRAARTRHFKIFATAHGKEKPKEIILLESQCQRAGGHAGAHAENLVDGEAFLVASAAVKVFEASMQAMQEKGLFPQHV